MKSKKMKKRNSDKVHKMHCEIVTSLAKYAKKYWFFLIEKMKEYSEDKISSDDY